MLRTRGGENYEVKKTKAGQESIWKDGAPFRTRFRGMWDYDLRAKAMDKAKAADYPDNTGDIEGLIARVDALPATEVKRLRRAAGKELFKL